MKQFKSYEEYKDSGIEWIGEIPKHWDVKKIKQVADIETGNTPPKEDKENYADGLYLWVKPDELNELIPIVDSKEKLSEKGKKLSRLIPKGSILVCGIGTIGKMGLAGMELSTNQQINSIIFGKRMLPSFGKFLFFVLKQEEERYSNKVVVSILNKTRHGEIKLSIPPLSEQQKITDFLDEKTSKIDWVIKNKNNQKELLKEYEKIMINKAVTKGLDKIEKIRDSKHPWIYEINSMWKEKKLQYLSYIKGRIGWQGLNSDEYLNDGDYYLITGTDFNKDEVDWNTCHYVEKKRFDEDPYIQLKEEDVLITKDGSIGKIMQIKNLPKPATLNSGIFVTRPLKKDYVQRFMFWMLNSHVFNEFINYNKTGSTIAHLYQKNLVNFYIPLPKITEQQQIADFLDEKTSKIRKSIEIIEKEVEKLEEYQKILINEAVTGKIKVF